jgi:hypothetical protein
MKSLEKYRPESHFEARRPTGAGSEDDINDLVDYYRGLGTRQRALKRCHLITEATNGGGYEPYRGVDRGRTDRYGDPEVSLNKKYFRQPPVVNQ